MVPSSSPTASSASLVSTSRMLGFVNDLTARSISKKAFDEAQSVVRKMAEALQAQAARLEMVQALADYQWFRSVTSTLSSSPSLASVYLPSKYTCACKSCGDVLHNSVPNHNSGGNRGGKRGNISLKDHEMDAHYRTAVASVPDIAVMRSHTVFPHGESLRLRLTFVEKEERILRRLHEQQELKRMEEEKLQRLYSLFDENEDPISAPPHSSYSSSATIAPKSASAATPGASPLFPSLFMGMEIHEGSHVDVDFFSSELYEEEETELMQIRLIDGTQTPPSSSSSSLSYMHAGTSAAPSSCARLLSYKRFSLSDENVRPEYVKSLKYLMAGCLFDYYLDG